MASELCRCALAPLTAGQALRSWTFDPLMVLLVVGLAAWYAAGVRRYQQRTGSRWPVGRRMCFGCGLLLMAATTWWWVGAYARTLFWVYTVQIMILLVIAPALLIFGRPVTLSTACRHPGTPPSVLARCVQSAPVRVLSSPAFGPLLLPLVTMLVFFTAVLPASLGNYAAYEGVHLLLLVTGLLIALPLADEGAATTSMTIAAGLLFGFLELLADAVPGIAIRLRTGLLASGHYLGLRRTWGPSPLHDQQLGGAIVWFLAETIDLPVLALLLLRWIRADEREAVIIDRTLDEQQGYLPDEDVVQRPWWETDASVFGERRERQLRARRPD